jgi:glutamate--cysteine ligase regulatory subunit
LRSSFLAAKEDYADSLADGDGYTNGTGVANGAHQLDDAELKQLPASAWTAVEGDKLYVPAIHWESHGLQEEPARYDITAKIFFLPGVPISQRAEHVKEALELVLKALGAQAVDLLIVSFPGLSFEGDCEWEADKRNAAQGSDEDELATWPAVEELYRAGLAKKLGLAEYGSEKLSKFLQHVQVRPAVNQINLKNCCNVPPPLSKLAKEQGIELLVHSDCTDILPKGTLRELLGHGLGGAGLLADPETGAPGLEGDLTPQWVIKYTAVVRDRGVIENKGYFAGAALEDR